MTKYIVILLLLLPAVVFGQPVINTVTGTVASDSTLTITSTGSSFGSKASAPARFMDFVDNEGYSGLSHYDIIPVSSYDDCPTCPWQKAEPHNEPAESTHYAVVYYTDPDSIRVDGRAMYMATGGDGAMLQDTGMFYSGLSSTDKVYLNWWWWSKYQPYGTGSVPNKLLRLGAESDWTQSVEVLAQDSYGSANACGAPGWAWFTDDQTPDDGTEPAAATWINVEVFIDPGADISQGTGSVDVYFNGVLNASTPTLYSCAGPIGRFARWGFDTSGSPGYPADAVSIFGELYADNSWARVVIGNESTLAASTHREIQFPTAWAAGEVTVTANVGSFADSTAAYLYVIDSDGNVNATGYGVTISANAGNPAGITAAPEDLTASGGN